MHDSGKCKEYDLFAVSNHYGGMGEGHYISFTKNYFNKKWYKFNDSWCSEMSESGIITESAYILFYRLHDIQEINLDELYDINYEPMFKKEVKEEDKKEKNQQNINQTDIEHLDEKDVKYDKKMDLDEDSQLTQLIK